MVGLFNPNNKISLSFSFLFTKMWSLLEILLLTNLLTAVLPLLTISAKKIWSLLTHSVLAGCLLLVIISKLRFLSVLGWFFSEDVLFNFSVLFVLDNLTIIFCFMTFLTAIICQLLTWDNPSFSTSVFLSVLWLVNITLLHTFTSLNLLVFFVFFEMSLFPMTLIILLWGSRQRKIYAMYLFFFYTAFGSFLLFVGLLFVYQCTNTLLLLNLSYLRLDFFNQGIAWTLFFIGFMVKIPIVPAHTWLPEAHVEAPTIGSIILAGLMLKVGTFGLLKFIFPFLNPINISMQPVIFALCIISIYHTSLIALRQIDLKKIIAYSSIAHMGFVILGLFALNIYGILGALFIMFSHGLISSGLFFSVGVIYDRYKSKNIFDYSGLVETMPLFSIFFFFFILSNLSFPGTSSFAGELLVLIGVVSVDYTTAFLAALSIIITSAYSIWTYNRIVFGELAQNLINFSDINKNEFFVGALLIGLVLFFGLYPKAFLSGVDYFPFLIIRN